MSRVGFYMARRKKEEQKNGSLMSLDKSLDFCVAVAVHFKEILG
jgi:hypothetical protein